MLKNYLKTAIRNLLRQRLFSGLNIAGLATGMACSILIFLWVQDELSYDRFHANAANIYRLTARLGSIDAAVVPIPIAMAVRTALPAVINATRLNNLQCPVTADHKKFDEHQIYYADSNFLQIFNFPLAAGDTNGLLKDPGKLAITESAAIKYFGSVAGAIGKPLHIDNDYRGHDLVVTAVLKDVPANSHLHFNMLLPITHYEHTRNSAGAWGNYDVYTYFQLDPHVSQDPAAVRTLEAQINAIMEKNDDTHTKVRLSLQGLTDIHLGVQFLLDTEGHGNRQYVRIFSLVAIVILLIACINFMNLSTALSGRRAKEVGLRKTVGALRRQLVAQFLSESLLLSLVSLLAGLGLVALLLPLFNQLAAKNITLDLLNGRTIAGLLGTAIAVGLIAGSYPAFFLSSFNAVKVLKGVKVLHKGKSFFRNGLVVLQFTISVILMVSTLVVYRQLQFIHHRDIGFNKENLLYITLPAVGDLRNNYRTMKTALQRDPGIPDHTIVSHLPTYLTTGTTSVTWPGKDPNQQVIFPQLWVDNNFTRTFGIRLLTGRYFSESFRGDDSNYVVNETALRIMHMTAAGAVGRQITYNDQRGTIIGVVKDFNFKPVQQPIEPLILRNTSNTGDMSDNAGIVVIRSTPAAMTGILHEMKSVFQGIYPGYPFTYGFVKDDLAKLYTSEQQMGRIFNIFSILSILISCLGLFGLATFATQRRVKEIGVRKVLGASGAGIVTLLSREFIVLVTLALLIGFPLAGWIMDQWLARFVYRVSLSWWIFGLAGLIAMGIAMLTVSYQAIRAAMANPVTSLRSE